VFRKRQNFICSILLTNLHLNREKESNPNVHWSTRIERGLHHSTLEAVQSLLGDMAGLRSFRFLGLCSRHQEEEEGNIAQLLIDKRL